MLNLKIAKKCGSINPRGLKLLRHLLTSDSGEALQCIWLSPPPSSVTNLNFNTRRQTFFVRNIFLRQIAKLNLSKSPWVLQPFFPIRGWRAEGLTNWVCYMTTAHKRRTKNTHFRNKKVQIRTKIFHGKKKHKKVQIRNISWNFWEVASCACMVWSQHAYIQKAK